jgi:WD40 repeat protein
LITRTQGNLDSERPSISADGRFVAFGSLADNLVLGDTSGTVDIFVPDRRTGTAERVSISSDRRQGNQASGLLNGMAGPSISDDGRYLAFDSEASNLVPLDTNGTADVFVHDRLAGTTERVSVPSHGMHASGTEGMICGDGNGVAFSSFSDNLVPVRDRRGQGRRRHMFRKAPLRPDGRVQRVGVQRGMWCGDTSSLRSPRLRFCAAKTLVRLPAQKTQRKGGEL